MKLRLVEARSVAEHAGMFAETLAVVRDDDEPGPVEDGTTLELVDQPSQLLIEVRDTIVVSVASQSDLLPAKAGSAASSNVSSNGVDLMVVVGPDPRTDGCPSPGADRDGGRHSNSGRRKRADPVWRRDSQSRNSRLTTAAPLRSELKSPPELIHRGLQEIEIQPVFQETLDRLEPVHGTIDQDGRLERSEPRKDVVSIDGKTPVQSGVGRTIPVIGGETGRRITVRPQDTRPGSDTVPSRGVIQPAESS